MTQYAAELDTEAAALEQAISLPLVAPPQPQVQQQVQQQQSAESSAEPNVPQEKD